MKCFEALLVWSLFAGAAIAADAGATLQGPLAPISFLLGNWSSEDGRVADIGADSRGSVQISGEASGGAILSRGRTEVLDAKGNTVNSFGQLLMIYGEGGTLRADYCDREHVIHYVSAHIEAGRSVSFTSAAGPMPQFNLTYVVSAPNVLTVTFGIKPPGEPLRIIATGTLRRT